MTAPEGAEEALGTEEAPVRAGSNGGSGASGGQPYGNLANQLVGGNGGGGGISYPGGGGGGGAIELGTTGSLTINGGYIDAVGGSGLGYGGGGSGGGIFLHADSVNLAGVLDVGGGGSASGGGGGGGQILILANSYTATGAIDLAGGTSGYGSPGADGMITQAGLPVPEPSAIFLLASALPAAAWVWRKAFSRIRPVTT